MSPSRTLRLCTVVAVLLLAVVGVGPVQAANPHESQNNPIVCTTDGRTVTCGGTVVGLGNTVVIASVDAEFACATRGNEHQPGGHLQADSEPIRTRNGQITFEEQTGPARCPRGLNPVIGDTATVTLRALDGTVLFQEDYAIQPA